MALIDTFFETVKLPSISEVTHALIRTLEQDEVSVAHVRDLIEQDPALSAHILRLANSAHFGLPRGISTIDDAIAMVGISKVRTLAVGACLNVSFASIHGLDRKEFWNSSLACAGYAQWLAHGVGIDGQMAWLTGMMLRLGELLIAQTEPALLDEIERQPHSPGIRWQREKTLVGFTEGQITAELARRWNFPMQIVQALQRSAEPMTEQAFSRLGAILHLAELITETPHADAQVVDSLPQDVMDALKLDSHWLRSTFPQSAQFTNFHDT